MLESVGQECSSYCAYCRKYEDRDGHDLDTDASPALLLQNGRSEERIAVTSSHDTQVHHSAGLVSETECGRYILTTPKTRLDVDLFQ